MDVDETLCDFLGLTTFHVQRRCFDVHSTSFERYGRQIDVEKTLCISMESFLPQDVVLTSIQLHSNIMYIRWAMMQRHVITLHTGLKLKFC